VASHTYDAGRNVQAAIDLKAKSLLPVHWGKFTLALHAWDEPIKRVWKSKIIKYKSAYSKDWTAACP
jgi:hypothetical protein